MNMPPPSPPPPPPTLPTSPNLSRLWQQRCACKAERVVVHEEGRSQAAQYADKGRGPQRAPDDRRPHALGTAARLLLTHCCRA